MRGTPSSTPSQIRKAAPEISAPIIISSCNKDRALARSVQADLVAAGYSAWMKSTTESYDQGFNEIFFVTFSYVHIATQKINTSTIVLILASSSYRNDTECRTEAECSISPSICGFFLSYLVAYKGRKQIFVLVAEQNYILDGWLG